MSKYETWQWERGCGEGRVGVRGKRGKGHGGNDKEEKGGKSGNHK